MSSIEEIHFRLRIEEIKTGREIFQKYSLKQILCGAGTNSPYFNVVAADRFTEKYDCENTPIYGGDIVKSLHTEYLFKIVYECGKHVGRPLKPININMSDIATTDMKCYKIIGHVYNDNTSLHA